MTRDFGEIHGKTPAILAAIDADYLAHALKQKKDNRQYSVFGSNAKRVFSGLTPESKVHVLIRMQHTALAPGEDPMVDYAGLLAEVWLNPPADQAGHRFKEQFADVFGAPWNEVKCGAGKWDDGPWPVYFAVQDICYLRSPVQISELASWHDGTAFPPRHRVRRPTRIIWDEQLEQRLGNVLQNE